MSEMSTDYREQQAAAVPPSPPYDIVQSAVHTTRHERKAHTFLVNKDSGEVWQMLCHKNDDQVEFHKIHRYGFDGKPDDFSAVPRITLGPQNRVTGYREKVTTSACTPVQGFQFR
jgi:hypothetical protein